MMAIAMAMPPFSLVDKVRPLLFEVDRNQRLKEARIIFLHATKLCSDLGFVHLRADILRNRLGAQGRGCLCAKHRVLPEKVEESNGYSSDTSSNDGKDNKVTINHMGWMCIVPLLEYLDEQLVNGGNRVREQKEMLFEAIAGQIVCHMEMGARVFLVQDLPWDADVFEMIDLAFNYVCAVEVHVLPNPNDQNGIKKEEVEEQPEQPVGEEAKVEAVEQPMKEFRLVYQEEKYSAKYFTATVDSNVEIYYAAIRDWFSNMVHATYVRQPEPQPQPQPQAEPQYEPQYEPQSGDEYEYEDKYESEYESEVKEEDETKSESQEMKVKEEEMDVE